MKKFEVWTSRSASGKLRTDGGCFADIEDRGSVLDVSSDDDAPLLSEFDPNFQR